MKGGSKGGTGEIVDIIYDISRGAALDHRMLMCGCRAVVVALLLQPLTCHGLIVAGF